MKPATPVECLLAAEVMIKRITMKLDVCLAELKSGKAVSYSNRGVSIADLLDPEFDRSLVRTDPTPVVVKVKGVGDLSDAPTRPASMRRPTYCLDPD